MSDDREARRDSLVHNTTTLWMRHVNRDMAAYRALVCELCERLGLDFEAQLEIARAHGWVVPDWQQGGKAAWDSWWPVGALANVAIEKISESRLAEILGVAYGPEVRGMASEARDLFDEEWGGEPDDRP